MNHDFGLKQFLGAFLICVVAYFIVFYGIEHLRNREGPWEVTFSTGSKPPVIIINQSVLHIQNVEISFSTAAPTNAINDDTTILFDQARPVPFDVPFGQCIGLDTVTMPGTVDMKLNGHEIQLLPRVLTIDGHEHPWRSGSTFPLAPK